MIKLKEAVRIKGKIVIPYYIKDGDVFCFDKNGKQICLREEDFIQKETKPEKIQEVVPIIKVEEKRTIDVVEPKKTEEIKKEPEKKHKEQDNYIRNEDYI